MLIFSTSIVTLHIHVDPKLQHFNTLLKEEMSLVLNKPNTLETVANIAKNYWLIQLPNNETKSRITNLFQESELRYDSMVFAFSGNAGKLCVRTFIMCYGNFIMVGYYSS